MMAKKNSKSLGKNQGDLQFLLALSAAIMLIGCLSIVEKSETFDEPVYIGLGHYLVKTGFFNTETTTSHPPLSFYINSIPFYILDITGILPEVGYEDKSKEQEYKCFRCYRKYYYEFIYGEDFQGLHLLFVSRATMLIQLILLGIYFFKLSRELFGFNAASVTTILLVFNPNFLAHARLVTNDFTSALFGFIAFYYFIKYREKKDIRSAVLFGISMGLSLLSKTTNIYFILVYGSIIAIQDMGKIVKYVKTRDLKKIVQVILFSFLIIVSIIVVVNTAYMNNQISSSSKYFAGYTQEIRLIQLSEIPLVNRIPVTSRYMDVIRMNYIHSQRGHPNYFMGTEGALTKTINDGRERLRSENFGSSYWLTTFIIKTPEGILILIAFAFFYFYKKIRRKNKIKEKEGLIYFTAILNIIVYLLFLRYSNINIGIRLMLLLFPFIYILLLEPISYLIKKRYDTLVFGLLGLSLLPIILYFPHYIPYFNMIIGGPTNGYYYVSDSNIDWGQDLPGLKIYMQDNNIESIKLAYFGMGNITGYGINYISLENNQRDHWLSQRPADLPCGPTSGILAISATSYTGQYGVPGCYRWLDKFKPFDNIGYSILLYNITEEQIS